MKKIQLSFIFFVYLLFSLNILAQGIPETINYQGILKDATGVVVPNGDYTLAFKLYDVESGGTAIWTESKLITVTNGIINTQLGSVTPIPPVTFNAALWLGITVAAGSELTPRIALSSVPYSFISMTVPDGSLTASKIADDEVVKSLNGLRDNVNLVAGSNVTITPSGNDLTISSTGGGAGISGSGTTDYLAKFTGGTSIGNTIVSETFGKIGLDDNTSPYKLSINSSSTTGLGLKIHRTGGTNLLIKNDGSPADEKGWAFNVFNSKLQIRTLADDDITTLSNVITFQRDGNVGIGTVSPNYPLHVAANKLYAGYFTSDSLSADTHPIHGEFTGTGNIDAKGVYGKSTPYNNFGYGGYFEGGFIGARGIVTSLGAGSFYGVKGSVSGGTGSNYAFYGSVTSGTGTNCGIYADASGGATNWAGYFNGNVNVTGTLSKGGGSFKIDHPLDPTNKNLYHSFVESPDMMNIYNGNVITDGLGYATVTMPDWFEALNKDFRYQLTVIGDFAQAIISQKIQNNQFIIRTDKPGVEVSWQITGIRHDKFAEKYRIPVEENKSEREIGKYIHPDAFGVSKTLGVDYSRNLDDREGK